MTRHINAIILALNINICSCSILEVLKLRPGSSFSICKIYLFIVLCVSLESIHFIWARLVGHDYLPTKEPKIFSTKVNWFLVASVSLNFFRNGYLWYEYRATVFLISYVSPISPIPYICTTTKLSIKCSQNRNLGAYLKLSMR